MNKFTDESGIKAISPQEDWCVHSYYSLCPYAPDGSGRILVSGTDLAREKTHVYILDQEGTVLDRFGQGVPESNFYHTGSWQTWSPDGRYVYYQGGTMKFPKIFRYDTLTHETLSMDGDMEGAPPTGEPIFSGYLGMLYAAGYADGHYYPEKAPIPFPERDRHGLFRFNISEGKAELALSVNQILAMHPEREKLLKLEEAFIRETGHEEGFTLMAYCVRWNTSGSRCLFYFGNHCVDGSRKEPKLSYVFTADREFRDIRLALDLGFDHPGVHWSWHPDQEHLIGYACHPDNGGKRCLCSVRYDGSDFKMISKHSSGGHPSISPADYQLLVTDECFIPGRVVFLDLTDDTEVGSYTLPRVNGDQEPQGRNPYRVCHHPVFRPDGKKILANILPGENAVVCEFDVPERKQKL